MLDMGAHEKWKKLPDSTQRRFARQRLPENQRLMGPYVPPARIAQLAGQSHVNARTVHRGGCIRNPRRD